MIKYRPDIDGLRGIAVLIVVLFHAGLPYISGGFVGVDIFFVISGYLITSIILKDMGNNAFSFINFYERRARRILPALYFMVCVVLLVALFIQTPNDLVKSSNTVIAALLFSSNIYFWRTTNYFSDSAELEPFLHTWSLGVEEQFYFVFPLFLLMFVRKPGMLKTALILTFISSFAISVYATYFREWAGYYLLPSRAWQMMAGAIVAIYPVTLVQKKSIQLPLSIACLSLLIIPAFTYSHDTRFPGVAAIAPTLGATLAIVLGTSLSNGFATRFLSIKPLVWLGLISYSLYLWHWPVFAFLRNYQANVDLSYSLSVMGILSSVILAYLSWRFVETPFRNKTRFDRKTIFSLAGSSSFVILFIAGFIVFKSGLPARMDADVVRLAGLTGDYILDDPCMRLTDSDIDAGKACLLNPEKPKQASTFAFWGDSHAGSLKRELMGMTQRGNLQGTFFGSVGCPPLPGILKTNFDSGRACMEHNEAALADILSDSDIQQVVLHARWALSVNGNRYEGEKGPSYIIRDIQSSLPDDASNAEHVRSALTRLVKILHQAGKDIVIISSVPEVGANVPRVLANNMFWGKDKDIRPSRKAFAKRQHDTNNILALVADTVTLIDPSPVFCDETYCRVADGPEPLYVDYNHVSDHAAQRVLRLLVPFLTVE